MRQRGRDPTGAWACEREVDIVFAPVPNQRKCKSFKFDLLTAQHVSAECPAAALFDGRHDLQLGQTQVAALLVPPSRPGDAEDVRGSCSRPGPA